MQGIGINQNLSQIVTLSLKQVQSIQILQMDADALEQYLQQQLESNPVLEEDQPPHSISLSVGYEDLGNWGQHRRDYSEGHVSSALEYAVAPDESETLHAFLWDQLERLHLPAWQIRLCKYLTCLLDEDGYLPQDELDALYADADLAPHLIDASVTVLQSLEPAGIAARDLKSCLLLQLNRLKTPHSTALRIVEAHLTDLATRRYSALAKKMQRPVEEILCAAEQICALNPRPAAAFAPPAPAVYVRPEAYVAVRDGHCDIVLECGYLHRLKLSDTYIAMERETNDTEAGAYLREKIAEGNWLLSCLKHRNRTLERCIRAIVETQADFFLYQTQQLRPMTLAEVARALGVHESTISRTISGKYLVYAGKTYPLRYFFSNPSNHAAGAASAQSVRNQISRLIKQEDKREPLSDQQIQALLKQEFGMTISRRTVAKYRSILQIPSVNERRTVFRKAE